MTIPDLRLSISELPFKSSLSFRPLLKHLKAEVAAKGMNALLASVILERIKEAPELEKPVVSLQDIKRHKELVHFMLSVIFPPALSKNVLSVASIPFEMTYFYCTPKYKEVIEDESKDLSKMHELHDPHWMLYGKLMHAYLLILKEFYDFDLWVENLFMYRLKDKFNGLEKYFKIEIGAHCAEIVLHGDLKPISKEEIYNLINHPFDMDLWLKTIPLNNFEFSGFLQMNFVEVTQLEVISALKTELLQKSSIVNPQSFEVLEMKIRSLLGLPNVKLGITALHFSHGILDNPAELWNGLLCGTEYHCKDYEGTFYEEALREGKTVIMNDLSQRENPCKIEKGLLDQGIRNVSVTPLYYDAELVGLLEFGSTQAYDINFTQMKKITDIIPVFSIALKRSTEELINRVQATIKEECTAIHPSVEWRFQEAAVRLIQKRDLGESAKMEEIVFPEVYPLYGAIDIRHSSAERNKTIQEDLIQQLLAASSVLKEAFRLEQMPIYDQLIFKIDNYIRDLQKGLSSGDEADILNFLRREVECLFDHFNKRDSRLQKVVKSYFDILDSDHKIVFIRRKAFEDSLMMINDCISTFLDEEEEKAQAMFPHYFEKYRTDGVEHNIYIGQAMVKGREFSPIYLRNMRLWQLIVSCEISRRTHLLKPQMPIPLDTTALILVHSQPLSIRFRLDEKKFDVDGGYNIRYEIVKKRIDKALIKESKERLTQPGTVSVIFSQKDELAEYQRYFEYLIGKGYFEDAIEIHDLQDMPGVHGLRALRARVKNQDNSEEILKVAEGLNLEN